MARSNEVNAVPGRWLIIGGTGFVGRALVGRLVSDGAEVRVITRDVANARLVLPSSVDTRTQISPACVAGFDVVVNLAGESVNGRPTRDRLELIRSSRIETADRVALAIAACAPSERPRCFLSASATGIYADADAQWIDESGAHGAGFLARTCVAWEEAASRASGTRVVNLRFGIVLGGGGFMQEVSRVYQLGLGAGFGNAKQYWSWIHIDDAVSAIIVCSRPDGPSGPVNVTSPEPVTQEMVHRAFCSVSRSLRSLSLPAWIVRGVFGELAPELLESRRAQPSALLAHGMKFRFPEFQPAFSDALALTRQKAP